jgi:hypothetical protein
MDAGRDGMSAWTKSDKDLSKPSSRHYRATSEDW